MTPSTITDQQREADTVRSAPGRGGHHVPTLAAVDRVLGKLSADLRSPNLAPAGHRRILDDIDALLERRRWFMEFGDIPRPSGSPAARPGV